MLLDSTRTPRARPSGEEQKDYYSGKDKRHSLNTLAAAGPGGCSCTSAGRSPAAGTTSSWWVGGLAKVFPSTADPCTPDEKRVTVVGDAGFRGTEKRLPGIIPVTPHKRTALKGLTAAQKKKNAELSRERSLIERVFERVKKNTI